MQRFADLINPWLIHSKKLTAYPENVERFNISCFTATYCTFPSRPTSFSGKAFHISTRRRQTAFCSYYNTAPWWRYGQPTVQTSHQLKTFGGSLNKNQKKKDNNADPRLLSSWNLRIRQEHSSPNTQQLVSSVARHLWAVVKRRGDAAQF